MENEVRKLFVVKKVTNKRAIFIDSLTGEEFEIIGDFSKLLEADLLNENDILADITVADFIKSATEFEEEKYEMILLGLQN